MRAVAIRPVPGLVLLVTRDKQLTSPAASTVMAVPDTRQRHCCEHSDRVSRYLPRLTSHHHVQKLSRNTTVFRRGARIGRFRASRRSGTATIAWAHVVLYRTARFWPDET